MKRLMIVKGPAVLFIAFILFSSCAPKKKEQVKEEVFGATQVKVIKVVRQRISEKISYTGTLEAWVKVNITPEVGGKIAKIYVGEGDKVTKGQLLAELDTESMRLQLKQAEAGLAVAEANFKDASRNKERMDRLLKENAVSEQQYEKVKLGFEAAQAQIEQAQAAVNLARHALDASIMKAPFSGVIASKNASVGDVINPMMASFSPVTGVLTLMDFSKVKINIAVSQNDVLRIKKGQSAQLKVNSYPDREFSGIVSSVNQTADPTTNKFGVQVVVANKDLTLRPGTFGEVTFEVLSHEDALVLPQRAIIENKYVFLAKGNKVQKKEVTLGLQNTNLVEILNGVQEDDLVVIEGNYGLIDGSDIKILEEVTK